MHSEYDPDDNFARAFDGDTDVDDEAGVEALVWQLLLLVNPGDEDGAMQQFAAWREAREDLGDDADTVELLREATDWKSGFFVGDEDPAGLIDALDELASRFDIRIDWGTDDPSDDDFLADTDVPALINIAYARLREHHYTVWTWETGADAHAGWITRQGDDEALRAVAGALGYHVRTGAG